MSDNPISEAIEAVQDAVASIVDALMEEMGMSDPNNRIKLSSNLETLTRECVDVEQVPPTPSGAPLSPPAVGQAQGRGTQKIGM